MPSWYIAQTVINCLVLLKTTLLDRALVVLTLQDRTVTKVADVFNKSMMKCICYVKNR